MDVGAAAGDDLASWPGLESLPPSPPVEYPPPRPFRRTRVRHPPAALPPPGAVGVASAADGPAVPPGSTRRRTGPITLVAAVVAFVVLASAALVVGRDQVDQDEAAATAASTTTTIDQASTSTTAPDPTSAPSTTSTLAPLEVPPDPPLAEAIAEVSVFVADNRGLAFAGPVDAIRLPDAEFEQRLRERAMADALAIEAEGNMLKLLGLVDPDVDYLALYLATVPAMIGAYFDPESSRIVARGEPGTPVGAELRVTLAHELTHALDFERFDLASRSYADPDTEQQFGLDALIEGDAMRIEHLWAQAHGEVPATVMAGEDGDFLSSRIAVTYELGEKLVDDIVARGGLAALDAAFDDPPTTSEQIMHPEKYAAREVGLPIEAPTADGDPLWTGVTGEYTTGQMLRSAVGPEVADRAAAGWGNDRGVLWLQPPSEGGLTCRRIAYTMDGPADLAELDDAFASWARAAPHRTALLQTDRLVVTMCDDVPPPPVDFGRAPSPT